MYEKDESAVLVDERWTRLTIDARYELLEARNPAAKLLSSEMELAPTVPHTVEELCRLAIQEQEEDEQ